MDPQVFLTSLVELNPTSISSMLWEMMGRSTSKSELMINDFLSWKYIFFSNFRKCPLKKTKLACFEIQSIFSRTNVSQENPEGDEWTVVSMTGIIENGEITCFKRIVYLLFQSTLLQSAVPHLLVSCWPWLGMGKSTQSLPDLMV